MGGAFENSLILAKPVVIPPGGKPILSDPGVGIGRGPNRDGRPQGSPGSLVNGGGWGGVGASPLPVEPGQLWYSRNPPPPSGE